MSPPDPRKALEALASEHGLPILRFLRDRDWTLASQVSEALGIHTTTASKHLTAFYDAGFLARREHPARRPTHAYRLKSPVIRLEFDLAERVESSDAVALGAAFFEALMEALEHVGGARLTGDLVTRALGGGDWRPALGARLSAIDDPRAAFLSLIGDTRQSLANLVGHATADRLVRMAMERAAEGRADLVAAIGLPEAMP